MPVFARLLIPMLLTGCATHVLTPADFRLSEASYGLYEIVDGVAKHLSSTEVVPCELGVVFGADLDFALVDARTSRLPIRLEWHHSEIPGVRGKVEVAVEKSVRVRANMANVAVYGLFRLGETFELESGPYDLVAVDPTAGDILYTRTFRVDHCN